MNDLANILSDFDKLCDSNVTKLLQVRNMCTFALKTGQDQWLASQIIEILDRPKHKGE